VAVAPVGRTTIDFGGSSLYITDATNGTMVLDGRGVLLLFEPGHGVLVSGSRHATLRNISVDYDPPCFAQGVVVALPRNRSSAGLPVVRVRIAHGYPTPAAAYIRDAAESKVIFFSPDGFRFSEGQPSADGMQSAVMVHPRPGQPPEWDVTLPPFRGGFVPTVGSQVTIGPRIGSAGWERPASRPPFYDLGVGPTWASSTTWLIADSENITSESITLHGAGDMGFLESGGKCGHTYRGVTLTRSPSSHARRSGRAPSEI
jgi:hypothetical protein